MLHVEQNAGQDKVERLQTDKRLEVLSLTSDCTRLAIKYFFFKMTSAETSKK